jgi:hypothetical protein
MKTRLQKSLFILAILALMTNYGYAQLNGFELTPSGDSENYMKYIRKPVTVNGTSYFTGYLTLSSFRNYTTNVYTNDITPFQKLQIQGGNILLCHSNSPSTITDINPTSKNGAILFSDWASDNNTYKHGKWGIEYESELSSGGLNFFNPVSQLFSERQNFRLFISNTGNVGIGSSEPVAKLQINEGDIYIKDINRGIIMTSPDGNCWRGVLNNQGQLEFVLLPDCSGTLVSSQQIEAKPGISISPNPASGLIRISCTAEDLTKFSSFKIMDAFGREVNTYNLDSANTQIETHNLKPGIYFINFIGKNAYWTEKVVVQ